MSVSWHWSSFCFYHFKYLGSIFTHRFHINEYYFYKKVAEYPILFYWPSSKCYLTASRSTQLFNSTFSIIERIYNRGRQAFCSSSEDAAFSKDSKSNRDWKILKNINPIMNHNLNFTFLLANSASLLNSVVSHNHAEFQFHCKMNHKP